MVGASDLVQTVSDAIYNASIARTDTETSGRSYSSANDTVPNPEDRDVLSRLPDTDTSAGQNAQIVQQGPRFLNKPHGTPLGTILEQHSSYTLRSRCSNKTLTINSYRLPNSKHQVLVEFQPGPVQRVRALSVDEGGMSRLRRVRTILDQEMGRLRMSSDTTDNLLPAPTGPAQPPYPPPQRPTTPVEGVNYTRRSWSVRVCRRVRRRVSKVFGRRVRPAQESLGFRWRPPVGHMPRRFEAPGAHPFHQALAPPLSSRSSKVLHNNITAPPISPWREQSLRRRSYSGDRSVSAAQRALGAITGQTIPVNPARALSPGTARSVSVPKRVGPAKLVTISRDRVDRETSNGPAFGTTRTIDMIEQFPLPPVRSKSENSQPPNDDVSVILAPSPLRPKRTSLDVLRLQKAGSDMADQFDCTLGSTQQNQPPEDIRASGDRMDSCTDEILARKASADDPSTVTTQVENTAVGCQLDGSSTSAPFKSRYRSSEPLIPRQPIVNDPVVLTAVCDVRVDNTHVNNEELYMSGALPSPPATPDIHVQSLDAEPSFIIDKPQPEANPTAETSLVHSHAGLINAFHSDPHEETTPRIRSQPLLTAQSRDFNGVQRKPVSECTFLQVLRQKAS
ncbi:hypothetical protein MBLNU457_6687t2 [Dothideomycetes sp. NU457]